MTSIIVGCPVSHRAWVLDRWFDHVEQAMPDSVDYEFLFVGDPDYDSDSFDIIHQRCEPTVVEVPQESRTSDARLWDQRERKELMVMLRNMALIEVQVRRPDYYLSLDSDILVHPDTVVSMLDAAENNPQWAGIGGKCYMEPIPQGAQPTAAHGQAGTACPSYLTFGRAGLFRRQDVDVPSLFEVDCIMALKLMTPAAYEVSYRYHKHGEDVGWAYACKEAGLRFGWDARTVSKHVMREDHLDMIDPRCGF